MSNLSKRTESVFSTVIYALQLYASWILGWMFYHNSVLPASVAQELIAPEKFDQIRIYALHVAAFSSLAYLLTKPIAGFIIELLRLVESTIRRAFR